MDQRRVDQGVLALWCHELGTLMDLGVPVLSALEVVAQQIEPLAPVTVQLESCVQAGDSLAHRIAEMDEVFPPLLRAAALAGEAHERLAEALLAVAECLRQSARLGVARTSRERLAELAEQATPAPAVVLSKQLLTEAVETGARRLRITGGSEGGLVEAEVGGTWQVLEEVDRGQFAPLCRRLKLMAAIPYWISEPAVGTIRLSTADSGDWDVAVQAIPDEDRIGQHIEMTFVPRAD